ncbi:MAG: type II toxin-antitoxin system ParD family antitoxin [Spirulina sp. SIO3F2]|nr:type II toxin-antitoxin system ParD family antitoxin [Spirulina sp. SIO3F2]
MNLPLSPKLQEFTEHQLASGKYSSLDELLIAGLQVLAERELIYQGRFEELRQEILLGAVEAEQGELLEASTEISSIRQRLRQRHS